MSNSIRASNKPSVNNTESPNTKQSKKRLSPNKFRTLKSGFNNRAKNQTIAEQDLQFSITYTGEDLNVIYSHGEESVSDIFIRRPGNKTNCIILSYNKDTHVLTLESLLNKVALNDKCRLDRSGTYYLDIMFLVIKSLQSYPKITFNPCLIELYDVAEKNIFKFDTQKKMRKLEYLSVYKLLIDGCTFYEKYGFIPTEISDCSSTIDYIKLENLISIRWNILNLPIENLESYIKKKADNIKKSIFKDIKEIKEIIDLVKKHELTNENVTLSNIFKLIIGIKEPTIIEQNLCIAIYNFVYIVLPELYGELDLVVSSALLFSYVITSDKTHYSKIAAIYSEYNIQRYEEYADYLAVIPKEL